MKYRHNKSTFLTRPAAASLFLLLALGSSAPLVGCASDADDGPSFDSVGSLGVKLKVAPGVTLLSVGYQITGNGLNKTGSIDVGDAPTITGTIGGIPAGNGYTIKLTATSVEDGTIFTGSATFDVTANHTTPVSIHLTGSAGDDTGGVAVNGNVTFEGTVNVGPAIDEFTVAPLSAFVGGDITLQAVASDADNGPSALSYAWSATGGVIEHPSQASTKLTSSAAGPVTVTLTVSDGSASNTQSISVSFVQ